MYYNSLMQTVFVQDDFRIAVLDQNNPDDLEVFFQAEYSYFRDSSLEEEPYRDETIVAYQESGSITVEDKFHRRKTHKFVLFKDNVLAGYAELGKLDSSTETAVQAYFSSAYIQKSFRGQHLIDLLHQVRENFAKTELHASRLTTEIKACNLASQRAACRFGFHETSEKGPLAKEQEGWLFFAKDLTL